MTSRETTVQAPGASLPELVRVIAGCVALLLVASVVYWFFESGLGAPQPERAALHGIGPGPVQLQGPALAESPGAVLEPAAEVERASDAVRRSECKAAELSSSEISSALDFGSRKVIRICGADRNLTEQDAYFDLVVQAQPTVVWLASIQITGDASARDQHLQETPIVRVLDTDGNPHPRVGFIPGGLPRLVSDEPWTPAPAVSIPAAKVEHATPGSELRVLEFDYSFELSGVDGLVDLEQGLLEVTCHGKTFRRGFQVLPEIQQVHVIWNAWDLDSQIEAGVFVNVEVPEDYVSFDLLDGGLPVPAEVVKYVHWDDYWEVTWEPESWPLLEPSVVVRVETEYGRVLTRALTPETSD